MRPESVQATGVTLSARWFDHEEFPSVSFDLAPCVVAEIWIQHNPARLDALGGAERLAAVSRCCPRSCCRGRDCLWLSLPGRDAED
jgi:hypothetical protein